MTSSGSIPAIIVSDFDTEAEDHKIVFKPKNKKKLAKIEIVLPSVPDIVETLKLPKTEIDENEQTSTTNSTISEVNEKQETSTAKSVISKFTKKAKKLVKSSNPDEVLLINDGDKKATHPKEKKKVGIGKKTKRKSIRKYSKLMHEKDDDNVFEEMVSSRDTIGGFGRRIFNKNEILESFEESELNEEEDILKDLPDYERSKLRKIKMQNFLRDFNTLLTTGKYLNLQDFQFCLNHTHFKESEILNWFKGFRQECPTGHLAKAHLSSLFKKAFNDENGDVFSNHIFRIFDKDGNGFLDFKEFLMAIDVTTCTTLTDRMTWAFRLYDVDNNGVIDIDEMTEIIEILDDIQGKSETETEGQGDLTVPGEDPEPKSAKEKAEMFLEILDVDGSGGITLDEFLKAGKRLFRREDDEED